MLMPTTNLNKYSTRGISLPLFIISPTFQRTAEVDVRLEGECARVIKTRAYGNFVEIVVEAGGEIREFARA